MIGLQILNKIINEKSLAFLEKNNLTDITFTGFEAEFEYIKNHYEKYKSVPDKETFAAAFSDFEFFDVCETDKYLLDTIKEEKIYEKSVTVLQTAAEILKTDAVQAVDYLKNNLEGFDTQEKIGTDIVAQAEKRLEVYREKLKGDKKWYIPTGFEELDFLIHGWARGEELVVFFARTGEGKSWALVKSLQHAWKIGYKVGLVSPEMSPVRIGYRFDTVNANFSNKNLIRGNKEETYEDYINILKETDNRFLVATPQDFNKKITVNKLKSFIKNNNLDILGVDGITYLTDQRNKKGDNKTITLTNISEDLISLSLELQVPIIVVVQANRGGIREEDGGTPDLENIRDSDGISHNATKVIALRQKGAGIEFGVKKHRDGATGGKLYYYWDIDKGKFEYVPSEEDGYDKKKRAEKTAQIKAEFDDELADIF